MTVRETLAKNLAHYREQAGYTQKSASVALRTHPKTPATPVFIRVFILSGHYLGHYVSNF